MSGHNRSNEELFERYPNYKTYTKCQSKAFTTGMFTLVSTFAGVYVAQELLKERLPYPRTSFLLPPVIIGSIASYVVTRWKTKQCQTMWLALEDKHTALTQSNGREDKHTALTQSNGEMTAPTKNAR